MVAITMVVGGLIVATVILRRIWRVGDGETGDDRDAPQGFIEQKCFSFRALVLKTFPLTAVKIAVVVWQIVSQVRKGADHYTIV